MRLLALLLLLSVCASAWADDLGTFVTTRTASPDGRFAIGLDGTHADDIHIHLVRLLDRKTGKFIGRKNPIPPQRAEIDVRIPGKGKDTLEVEDLEEELRHSWSAMWHPQGRFVVLTAPLVREKHEAPKFAHLFYQVTDTGLLPMGLPDLQPHAARHFHEDEVVFVEGVSPQEWISRDRLHVYVNGCHDVGGGESPDYRLHALLKFTPDGNIVVDALF